MTDHGKGIATEGYSPLAAVTKAAPGPIDEIFDALAKKYAVSPGEISLRWCVDQDVVAITTSSKEQRLSDYLRAMTFKLTPREIAEVSLSSMRRCRRYVADHCWTDQRAWQRKVLPV